MRLAERSAGRFLSTVEIRREPAVKADVRGSAPHTGEAAARGASCFSHVPGHLVQIISHYGVSVIDPQGEVLEKRGTVEKHVVHNKVHSGARTGCWYPNEGHRIRLTMLCSEQGERWAHGFVNRRSGVRFPSPAPSQLVVQLKSDASAEGATVAKPQVRALVVLVIQSVATHEERRGLRRCPNVSSKSG